MTLHGDFNPRSPWGERPDIIEVLTSSVEISIHAPRGGSDREVAKNYLKDQEFQSTLPVGGATMAVCKTQQKIKKFQSTLPVGGATVRGFG